jgi:hypothetical protein
MNRGVLRRKIRRIAEGGPPRAPGESVRRAAPEHEHPGPAEAEWSRRYTEAARQYERLDLSAPEAMKAVIDGLLAWDKLLPQRSVAANGTPQPANTWGLGAERCVLRALNSHLVAIGEPLLAARIRSEMADLLQTAEALDECCMQAIPDPHAEKRLVATARIQTKALIELLLAVRGQCGRRTNGDSRPRRKRGHPPSQAPGKDRQLMDEWAAVRGRAGMSRKEFCATKGISFRAFIQAQDRLRKQASQSAAYSVTLAEP